ncbi:sigma-70 family RNA polymerase sigma factor [Bacillus sp. RD4P76]|uniref:Sigma-70 family RNA polymerase sigma factor n=1 Tax=Bacillus suaedaesalsae TaxID=2810349 RepID=A0ABS2DHK7_9BACI|nr:sigma-70 family RNA polymerase sigma factor [Bacillus suaedaesalsae]
MIDAMGTKVMRLAFTYVKDEKISEDITQEVFLRCYKHIDQFRGDASIKTWIYTITANLCKDYLRSWSYRRLFTFERLDIESTSITSVLDYVLDTYEKRNLANAVLQLPIKYREVIILHYYEDYSVHEIKDILQLNEDTIRTRLRRAREKLKLHYSKERLD